MLITWLLLLSSLVNGNSPPSSAAPAAIVHPSPAGRPWQLEGVALGDSEKQVRVQWGKPGRVTPDEWQPSCETWSYKEGKNVGLCEEQVVFVQVTAEAGTVNLDGREFGLESRDLRRELGAPAFEAEDGWGVERVSEALKVFVDERGQPVSLDLFHAPCNL